MPVVRLLFVSFLLLLLGAACEGPGAPFFVSSLPGGRPLRALDAPQVAILCGEVAARLDALEAYPAAICSDRAAAIDRTPEECAVERDACLTTFAAGAALEAELCTTAATTPSCPAAVTIRRYEDCVGEAVSEALRPSCDASGDADALAELDVPQAVTEECAWLAMAECEPFVLR